MQVILIFKFIIEGIVIFTINLMKHWTLLLLPAILETELKIRGIDQESYIMINYIALFYGTMIGTWFWSLVLNKCPASISIWLSLLMVGICNYFMFLTNSFSYMIFFRFLKGISMNVQKIGKAYVHEFMDRRTRKLAFLIENISYVAGTLAGPFLGSFFYNEFNQSYSKVALLVTVLFLLLALGFILMNCIDKIKKPKPTAREKEKLYFRDGITIVLNKTWKEVFSYCFFTNRTSKYLSFIYIVNSACFHVDLVITTSFFRLHRGDRDVYLDREQLAHSNLLGTIPSILFIIFLDRYLNDTVGRKLYIKYTIYFSFFSLAITPFLRYYLSNHCDRYLAEVFLFIFYSMKITFSYYLYTNVFAHLMNISIYKSYRKRFNIMITFFKHGLTAILFNLLTPFFKYVLHNKEFKLIEPYNYAIIFWIIAIVQGSSIFMIERFHLPLFDLFN